MFSFYIFVFVCFLFVRHDVLVTDSDGDEGKVGPMMPINDVSVDGCFFSPKGSPNSVPDGRIDGLEDEDWEGRNDGPGDGIVEGVDDGTVVGKMTGVPPTEKTAATVPQGNAPKEWNLAWTQGSIRG